MRAILMGMVTGFVPTNTMAAGHMLEMLLRRPNFMARARAAALANDDDLLSRCLFEAMRFKPLNPGPFRDCLEDYVVGADTPRATKIRAGMKVLVSTQSAMFDPRVVKSPRRFQSGPPRSRLSSLRRRIALVRRRPCRRRADYADVQGAARSAELAARPRARGKADPDRAVSSTFVCSIRPVAVKRGIMHALVTIVVPFDFESMRRCRRSTGQVRQSRGPLPGR